MFGMGFAEILIIGIIAILFLGPDKLPETMVEIAKFFRNVKKTVASAKDSLEEELHIADIKEEANSYKRELTNASAELERMTDVSDFESEIRNVKAAAKVDLDEPAEPKKAPSAPAKPEVVTFEKKRPTPSAEEENS